MLFLLVLIITSSLYVVSADKGDTIILGGGFGGFGGFGGGLPSIVTGGGGGKGDVIIIGGW